ncbi:hypothetical protein BR93DRAFT_981083 [Coniochaeta sp. PMI_546]|nr:hypothetical protein BR93DRAFT_981083 [Coniochaeta sp. PMI_546]
MPDYVRNQFSGGDPAVIDTSTPKVHCPKGKALFKVEQATASRDQTETALYQERIVRLTATLDHALKDRDRERTARETTEKARSIAVKAFLEANAELKTKSIEWQQRVDGLQETICALEATVDRNTSEHNQQILNEKILAELRDQLHDYEARHKIAISTIADLTGRLQESEANREAAVYRSKKLQEQVEHCEQRLGEVEVIHNEKLQHAEDSRKTTIQLVNQLQDEVTRSEARRLEVEGNCNAAIQRASQLQNELNWFKTRHLEAEGNCKTATQRVNQLKDTLRESELRRREAESASSTSAVKLGKIETKVKELEIQNLTAIHRVIELQYEMKTVEENRQAEANKLHEFLNEVQESHKTATQQMDRVKGELALLEERHFESEIEVSELRALNNQLREQAEAEAAELRDLREQLQETDYAREISTEQAAQLHKTLTLSEHHRLKAELQTSKLQNLRKKQLQQRDERYKAAVQRVVQLENELEKCRKFEDLATQLRDHNTMLVISDKSNSERAENAENGHRQAEAALEVVRAHLTDVVDQNHRATKQIDELGQDYTRLLATCACLTAERDEALIVRDTARKSRDEAVIARDYFQMIASTRARDTEAQIAQIRRRYRELEDASAVDKKVRAAQEKTAGLVQREVRLDARRRFCLHRDLLGLPKFHPESFEGWMDWNGLPDEKENAELEDSLGPSNMAWLRIALSLLKECEGIAQCWHAAAGTESRLRVQQEQKRAEAEAHIEVLRRAMGHDTRSPPTNPYFQGQPVPGQHNPQGVPQPPQSMPSPGFPPQGYQAQAFPEPQGSPPHGFRPPQGFSQPQASPSQGFQQSQGSPQQGSPPRWGPPPPPQSFSQPQDFQTMHSHGTHGTHV